MKLKKLIGRLMVIVIIVLSILTINVGTAYAASDSYILGVTNVREPQDGRLGGAYAIGGNQNGNVAKKIWKIVSYPTMASNSPNYENAFYCLRAELGFTTPNNNLIKRNYTVKLDMKTEKNARYGEDGTISEIGVLERLKEVGTFSNPDGTANPNADKEYNKIMWILDNMYLPKQSTEEERIELLTKAGIFSSEDDSYIGHERITKDDIEVVQQLALWYFTNADSIHYYNETLPTLYFNDWSGSDSKYESLEDLYNVGTDSNTQNGRFRQEECAMLYKYFLDNAKTKGDYVSEDAISPLTLDKSRVVLTQEGDNYLIGPFKINVNSSTAYTKNKIEFTDENGNAFNYTLLNANKQQVTNTIESLNGQDFYIKVSDDLEISKIKFDIDINYAKTSVTYYTSVETSYKNHQPVVLVEKENVNYNDNVEVIIPSKAFDLSLRKFITKINGVDVKVSREPVVDITNLANKTATTAIYNHPKAPLTVEIGDIVTYTVRVYNEGEKDGYVSEITDHLPPQLQFLPNDADNIANGWTYDSADSTHRTIKTSKLSRQNGTQNLIKAFNGTNLEYKDIEVKCRVISDDNFSRRIVNIADITGFTDKNGKTITDRDSLGSNVVLPSDEQLPNYKQEEISRGDKYIPGQQDDDDFDSVIIMPFDLSLRKFISAVNGNNVTTSREPVVDITNLANKTATTAIYNHPKAPLTVEIGDIVTYTIRVYNEGLRDGYASEITDHLPAQLEFLPEDPDNIANGWFYDENDINLRTIKTTHLSKDTDTDNLIEAFDGTTLKYKDVEVKCKVVEDPTFKERIVNIADITKFTDKNGNIVIDRDSQPSNVVLPSDEQLPNYKQEEIDRGDRYILGQQDDDDFDSVKISYTYFDLSLRKFITSVNGKVLDVSREPVVDVTPLRDETATTAIYNHPKDPVQVKVGDIVTYTIRVYNEGTKDGYVSEITDHLPKELEFLPEDKENIAKGWKYDETDPSHRTIKTDYLSKENSENNIIKAFNKNMVNIGPEDEKVEQLYYKDITVKCKVTADAKHIGRIVNIADITGFTDAEGNIVKDIDSSENNVVLPSDEQLPNYKQEEIARGDKYIPGQQDDDDFDSIEIVYFDLALRKFITKVDNLDINNRYPSLSMGEDGNIKYTHTKEPVSVANSNIVTYTIRVYNEGTIAGYAKEVTDDLPEGLVFLPENETNTEYRWIMLDKDGNKTDDVEKAEKITTDYLSKAQEKTPGENLLKAFDKKLGLTDTNPDYRDVKVAFKVTEPNTSDRILINTAEISEDSDEDDKPIDDIDSTPGNDKDGEDDIDIDKVKVKYFDLALKKWVTQAIVIQDGKTTITETGHTGEENPEPVVKVDLKKSDLKKVTVKFKYKIKVTNEGELEGYVKEIKDYIPDGLKFVAEDNPLWKQISEKEVTTDQTKDLLLKPGESTTVEIILTWENSDKNLGLKVNWAEISKDYNEYGDTPDIDSTPNNNKPGEDDIDNAPVILAIKTGEARMYITLSTIILVTMASGIVLIKKYVL